MKTIKPLLLSLTLGVVLFCSAMSVSAQSNAVKDQKAICAERIKLAKLAKKQAEANVWKDAKKAAKALEKEGWKPVPGSPTLETQQNDMMLRRYELKGNFPKYLVGRGTAVAQTAGTARKQALTRAKVDLAGSIGAEVASLTENEETNIELSSDEQQTVGKTIESSQVMVQQSIGRTEVVMEALRENGTSVEVMVYICCESKSVMKEVLKAFEKDHEALREKLEQMMSLED